MRAVAADPSNARAYAGLADTHALRYAFGVVARQDGLVPARAAAVRALVLDPGLAEAHTSLSFVLWEEHDRADALRAVERAIALDGRYPTARHWHALFLQDSGRYHEAIEEARQAYALDPGSPILGTDLALMLRNAGRLHEARVLLEEMLAGRHPAFPDVHFQLAELDRQQRRYEPALDHQREAVRLGDDRPPMIARLGWLEAANGNRGGAQTAARRLRAAEADGQPVAPVVMLEALVASGDLDEATRLVEREIDKGSAWVMRVTTDELFVSLRRGREWPALQRKIVRLVDTLPVQPVFQP
jgi:serine/threonine-protein kinase